MESPGSRRPSLGEVVVLGRRHSLGGVENAWRYSGANGEHTPDKGFRRLDIAVALKEAEATSQDDLAVAVGTPRAAAYIESPRHLSCSDSAEVSFTPASTKRPSKRPPRNPSALASPSPSARLPSPALKPSASRTSFPSLESTPQERMQRLAVMGFCSGGIYIFFILYGLLQEKLYTTDYSHTDGKFFRYTLILAFVQCSLNASLAFIATLLFPSLGRFSFHDRWPTFIAAAPTSVAFILATICSNAALGYINYPTQVLAKSVKMIPVMLFGAAYNRIRYKPIEYFWVALVTAGIVAFFLWDKVQEDSSPATVPGAREAMGHTLVLLSLVMDGVTGATQDRLVAKHIPTSLELMVYQNTWGAAVATFALLTTSEGFHGVAFLLKYRACIVDVLSFSMVFAAGQSFIFVCIRHFDALFCSTITTTRKFFTILASVLWYGHPLAWMQWIGVIMVFSGLLGKICVASSAQPGIWKHESPFKSKSSRY